MGLDGPISGHADISCARRAARRPYFLPELGSLRGEFLDRPEAGNIDGEKQIRTAIRLCQVTVERLQASPIAPDESPPASKSIMTASPKPLAPAAGSSMP